VGPAQTNPGFRGVCGPGYAAAVETCGQADRDALAGGMFSSGSGRVWVAVDTGCVNAGDRSTVRHEYVHATQYGYGLSFASGEWLASRWSIEGQAVLLQTDYDALTRSARKVTYGAASDTVSFTVVAEDPPTATIASPADGAFFAWSGTTFASTSVDFVGSGVAGGGGSLPGTALAWSYRRTGSATWTAAGTGTTTTIAFPYSGSSVNQGWEVRLIATEGALSSEPDVIGITVQRFPD